MKRIMFSLILACSITVSGCRTNNFTAYYDELVDEDFKVSVDETNNMDMFVKIIQTTNVEPVLEKYKKEGYTLIGVSSIEGEWEPLSDAVETAREKGASIIVMKTSDLGQVTKSEVVPITTMNTAYHNGNINTFGAGSATYSGTTTYSTTSYATRYYSVTRFYQEAYFLAKGIE